MSRAGGEPPVAGILRPWDAQRLVDFNSQADRSGTRGRQVICATGPAPKQVAGFKSEVLAIGFALEEGTIVLAAPDRAPSLDSHARTGD